ncbi:MAG: protein PhnA [Porticoccus sp.]
MFVRSNRNTIATQKFRPFIQVNIEQALLQRSNSTCELCTSESNLAAYQIPPAKDENADQCILACDICRNQIENPESAEPSHWRCLNGSMWSQVPAVQVMAWRMLSHLATEGWPQDLLDMLYLEDDVLVWAKAAGSVGDEHDTPPTLDNNGAVLMNGDTVTLIKALVVKGAGFTAKRGTAVRNISLTNNPEHIEGRVNGVRIVLLTCYLKKS